MNRINTYLNNAAPSHLNAKLYYIHSFIQEPALKIEDSIYNLLKTRALVPLIKRERVVAIQHHKVCKRGVSLYCLKPISHFPTKGA